MKELRLSYIHGFQDGVLGISTPQSKEIPYLEGFKQGKEVYFELLIEAAKKFPGGEKD